jgi:cell division transport system permease protein
MIAWYFKRAIEDILANRFLNAVTIATISLAILIVSFGVLLVVNTGDVLEAWKRGARIMAYLKPDAAAGAVLSLKRAIESIDGVATAHFIPRDQALSHLKAQMRRQASLFEHLAENPLPDAFEIRLLPTDEGWERIERIAAGIGAFADVDDVEYGQQWVATFRSIVDLLRLASVVTAGLFLLATVAIVANTIRLVIYSRQQEVDIMRLVGASEGFIKTPFYIEGLIQGFAGAAIGLGMLFAVFSLLAAEAEQSAVAGLFEIRFLSVDMIAAIVAASMIVGWLGCHVSLRQSSRS